jgi:hypothetical protein
MRSFTVPQQNTATRRASRVSGPGAPFHAATVLPFAARLGRSDAQSELHTSEQEYCEYDDRSSHLILTILSRCSPNGPAGLLS